MDIKRMLSDLTAERDRIDRAITALKAIEIPTRTAPKQRPVTKKSSAAVPSTRPKRARSKMSPAARKRMSEMMKKRWAERKKQSKPRAKGAAA